MGRNKRITDPRDMGAAADLFIWIGMKAVWLWKGLRQVPLYIVVGAWFVVMFILSNLSWKMVPRIVFTLIMFGVIMWCTNILIDERIQKDNEVEDSKYAVDVGNRAFQVSVVGSLVTHRIEIILLKDKIRRLEEALQRQMFLKKVSYDEKRIEKVIEVEVN